MPNSLKSKIKHLCHNRTITERECDRILKALEQEPCEDAISRQAVLDIIEKEEFKGDALSEIEKLPSVNPQKPKMGHWKERRNRATGHIETVCSECGAEEGYPYNDYCGNCGAQMFEPQESEDEE